MAVGTVAARKLEETKETAAMVLVDPWKMPSSLLDAKKGKEKGQKGAKVSNMDPNG